MKKYAFLFVVLFAGVAVAQVVTTPTSVPVTINVPTVLEGFSWKVFFQQLLTNGGLALAAVLAQRIPAIGGLVRKLIDVFSANVKH